MNNYSRKRLVSLAIALLMLVCQFVPTIAFANDNFSADGALQKVEASGEESTEMILSDQDDPIPTIGADEMDSDPLPIEEVLKVNESTEPPAVDESSSTDMVLPENEEMEEEDQWVPTNPDQLSGPIEVEAPTIFYPSGQTAPTSNRQSPKRSKATLEPGEVELTKNVFPVAGMVNTWDVKLRIEARDVMKTSDIVLVIDRSGSMAGSRITAAKAAAKEFVNVVLQDPNTRIAIVSFASDVTIETNAAVDSGFTSNQEELTAAIDRMRATGGTLTQGGMHQASALLTGSSADMKNIVLLSDGEPTFSYELENPNNYLISFSGNGWQTSAEAPATEYMYSSVVGSGSSMWYRYDNQWGNANDKWYNHGNSAIAESGFAKAANTIVYSIALQAGTDGTGVLNAMASPGKSFTADPEDLSEIYNTIAGEIRSAVQNAAVGDPMGTGFVVSGLVANISVSQGTATYDPDERSIHWDIGTPNQPIAEGSDIKYAELTYRIEIDDKILEAESTGDLFSTNGETIITYTNAEGEIQTSTFPVPTVDPILLILEKKLIDTHGDVITDDERTFNVRVTSDRGYDQTYQMTAGQRRVMTNLRLEDTYTVVENAVGGTPNSALADYDTIINVYDKDQHVFMINQGDPDSPVLVTNTEKPLGKLSVTKTFNPAPSPQLAFRLLRAPIIPVFGFTVTGPKGFSESFTLAAGQTRTFENLKYGDYTVTETDSQGFTPSYDPAGGTVTLRIDDKEKAVTVTNRPQTGDEFVDIVAKKLWVNGPETDHQPVDLILLQDGSPYQGSIAPLVMPITGPADEFNYTWKGLPKYRNDGSAHTYTVDEESIPKYSKSIDGLTITNTYEPDSSYEVTAYKTWVNGSPDERPNVWFALYRSPKSDGTTGEEAVPGADIQKIPTTGQHSVTWIGLESETRQGVPYTFTVREVNEQGVPFEPEDYTKSEEGLSVINTYQPPTGEVTATKVWEGGPTPKPSIFLKLYYQIDNEVAQPVEGAATIEIQDGETTATWENIAQTDHFGNPYIFSVKEFDAEGENRAPVNYVMKEEGLTVTNTYVSPLREVDATKIWVDGPSQKPTIGFVLYRHLEGSAQNPQTDGVSGATIKMLPNGVLSTKWTHLEETDKSGVPWIYYIREVRQDGAYVPQTTPNLVYGAPENYEVKEDGLTATNTYQIPNEGTATATKTWDGGPSLKPAVWFELWRTTTTGTDEKVPEQIMKLPAGSLELSATWENLDETDASGNPYTFYVKEFWLKEGTITEGSPDNYYATGIGSLNITNHYTSPLIEVSATKGWIDSPEPNPAIALQLLRKVADGEQEEVRTEVSLDGIVDTIATETGSGEHSAWKYSWKQLPETNNEGEPYIYSVREVTVPANYEVSYEGSQANGLIVNNTYQTLGFSATKVWDEHSPKPYPEIELTLKRSVEGGNIETVGSVALDGVIDSGTTDESSGELQPWIYTWKNLPQRDEHDRLYSYVVEETGIPASHDVDVTGNQTDGFTVTNTLITTEISAKKVFKNAPEGALPDIGFHLYRDNEDLGFVTLDGIIDVPDATGSGELGEWEYTWSNLPKLRADGSEYKYTVGEPIVPVGYVRTVEVDETGLTTITNTWRGGTFTALKKWDPEIPNPPMPKPSVKFVLLQQIEGVTANEYSEPWGEPVELDGVVDTGDHLSEDGEYEPWSFTWFNLPGNGVYNEQDVVYKYVVSEPTSPANYDAVSTATTIVTNQSLTTWFTATKEWDGGPKPNIQLQLMQGSEKLGDVVILDGQIDDVVDGLSGELEPWVYTWKGLERFDDAGNEYMYSVIEPVTPIHHSQETSEDGLTITNTYKIPLRSFVGEKTWNGGPKGLVQFQLKQGDVLIGDPVSLDGVVDDGNTGTDNGEFSAWVYTWNGLPETDADGTPLDYTIEEVRIPNHYSEDPVYEVMDNGMSVNNTYNTPQNGVVIANKNWVGGPETDHTAVTLHLYRQIEGGEKELVDAEVKISGTAPNFTYTWSSLEETDGEGRPFLFTVEEDNVIDGKVAIEDRVYTVTQEENRITNTYEVPMEGQVTATKNWIGGPEEDHTAVSLILYRQIDGGRREQVEANPSITGNAPTFSYTWNALEQTDNDGNAYSYTVEEEGVVSDRFMVGDRVYTVSQNGYDVTNTYEIPTEGEVVATKTWVGGPADDHRVVTIHLYRHTEGGNREIVAVTPEITGTAPTFNYVWSGLDETDINGNPYIYSVEEAGVTAGSILVNGREYDVTQIGNIITNTHKAPKPIVIDPPVEKRIQGTNAPNQEFTFKMEGLNGAPMPEGSIGSVKTMVVTGPGSVEFGVIPVTEAGIYKYRISEVIGTAKNWTYDHSVYTMTVTITEDGGVLASDILIAKSELEKSEVALFTNLYTEPDDTEIDLIDGEKRWIGDKETDRPEKIMVILYRDGDEIERKDVTARDNWKYSFGYFTIVEADGTTHEYSVKEVVPAGYTAIYDGYDIVNTRIEDEPDDKPITETIRGIKTWKNDREKDRPDAIIVVLYKDGTEIARKRITASSDWAYDFGEQVIKEVNGTTHIYKIGEIVPEGYTLTFDGYNLVNTKKDDPKTENPDTDSKPTTDPKPDTDPKPGTDPKPTPKPDSKPKPKPGTKNPTTGDAGVMGFILTACAAAGAFVVVRKRRNK